MSYRDGMTLAQLGLGLVKAGPQRPEFRRGGIAPGLAAWIEHVVVRHRRQVTLVHIAMFVVFVTLLTVPLLVPAGETGWLSRTPEIASFLIWGLWFPLVFLSVIVTGRSWCGLLCPMGAASEWVNKLGPRWPIPRWVQWPGTPIVSFVFITIWAQTAGARDHAGGAAIVFGSTLLAALALGFLFGRAGGGPGKRAWCRHMCPIGLLLGVYSRIGMADLVPKRAAAGGDRWTEKGVCPTMIDIDRKSESRHCIACARCVSPAAQGGLYLQFRAPGTEVAAIRRHNPNLSEVLFLFIGTGSALGGFLWLVLDSYQTLHDRLGLYAIEHGWTWLGQPGPVFLMAVYPQEREVFRWLDFFLISGYMLAWTVLVTAGLSAITALSAWLARRGGADGSFRERFVELGYQFLPVAMISLLLGLGGKLFQTMAALGAGTEFLALVKAVLFIGGGIWSVVLAQRLLARRGVALTRGWPALIPGAAGSLLLGAAWYPALFAS